VCPHRNYEGIQGKAGIPFPKATACYHLDCTLYASENDYQNSEEEGGASGLALACAAAHNREICDVEQQSMIYN
jgi:hypothetical protein